MKEIWKDIKGYKGFYQVSNLGRIKSMNRTVIRKSGTYKVQERIMKLSITSGYCHTSLRGENGTSKTLFVHQLVAIAFLKHIPNGHKIVVDHIDNNNLNNNLNNLQLITNRENCSKDKKGTSKYTGVCWDKSNNKWMASINIKGNSKALGRFDCELRASLAYKKALREL